MPTNNEEEETIFEDPMIKEETYDQPVNQPIQEPAAPTQTLAGGEPEVQEAVGAPIVNNQDAQEPIEIPPARVQLGGSEPSEASEAERIENIVEGNPQKAADVLPDEGPMADLDKEAKQAIDGGADAEVKNEAVDKAIKAGLTAEDLLFGGFGKEGTDEHLADDFPEDIPLTSKERKALEREFDQLQKQEWNKKSKAEKKKIVDDLYRQLEPQLPAVQGPRDVDPYKYPPPAIVEENGFFDDMRAPVEHPDVEWEIEDIITDPDLDEEDVEKIQKIHKWAFPLGKGMPDVHTPNPEGWELPTDVKQPTFSAGAGLGKPVASGGRNLSGKLSSNPMKASKTNTTSANNSGSAKVADDVTAVQDHPTNKSISRSNTTTSSAPHSNVSRVSFNGGSSLSSGGIEKAKGGKLIGTKGVKLPSGGGHTLGGTGKFDIPVGKGETKADRDLNLMGLEIRILSEAKNWKLVKGMRDSEDKLGAIRILVEEDSNQIWVSSGVTKGRARLETATKKDPQLIKYLTEILG